MVDDTDDEFDLMPIDEQMASVGHTLEEVTVRLAFLSLLFPRLLTAMDAGVLKPEQEDRMVAFIHRYQEIMAAALGTCSAEGVTSILAKYQNGHRRK